VTARTADPATVLAGAGHDLLTQLAQLVERHPDLRAAPADVGQLLDELAGLLRKARGRVRRAAPRVEPAPKAPLAAAKVAQPPRPSGRPAAPPGKPPQPDPPERPPRLGPWQRAVVGVGLAAGTTVGGYLGDWRSVAIGWGVVLSTWLMLRVSAAIRGGSRSREEPPMSEQPPVRPPSDPPDQPARRGPHPAVVIGLVVLIAILAGAVAFAVAGGKDTTATSVSRTASTSSATTAAATTATTSPILSTDANPDLLVACKAGAAHVFRELLKAPTLGKNPAGQAVDNTPACQQYGEVDKALIAYGIAEAEVAAQANTIPGEGVFVVGEDVKAGSYRTAGPSSSSCYYAIKDGAGAGADILDNNIIEGPGAVTLADGQVFETSRCQDWTLR